MDFLFYFFSVILVVSGVAVVTARNPVHAAMFLVLSFFTAACIWMLLEAEFLAITLVLVYIGAVMVLFLFVVMMLDINLDRLREGFWRWFPVGGLVAAIMVVEMVLVLIEPFGIERMPAPEPQAAAYSNTKELGRLVYTEYVYPFEIAAVILLVAIVAAIALTLRRRPGTKHQDPARQVAVKRRDRVRLVSMPAEKSGK
ncbi:MAG TPA: NADH-quinone oxidoreductase subunit J [Burkholderiales bacterium]